MCKWLQIIGPVLAVFLVVYGCNQIGTQKMRLCRQPFALCTSAKCIPLPNNPGKAVCSFVVEEGPSMATLPCDRLAPDVDGNGIKTLYSTYSFKQYKEGKQVLRCPRGAPWTDCLNKKCTVDPMDPKRAICTCDVIRSDQSWVTFGGDCDPSTCQSAYWSGATVEELEKGSDFLAKQLGLNETPVRWCPRQSI